MELYDIYDATDDELVAEARRIRSDGAQPADRDAKLLHHIEQELFERSVVQSVTDLIGEIAEPPSPTGSDDAGSPRQPYARFEPDSSAETVHYEDSPPTQERAPSPPHPQVLASPTPTRHDDDDDNDDDSEPATPARQPMDSEASTSELAESPSVLDCAMEAFKAERHRLESARRFNRQRKFLQDRETIINLTERRKSYAATLSRQTEKRRKASKQKKAPTQGPSGAQRLSTTNNRGAPPRIKGGETTHTTTARRGGTTAARPSVKPPLPSRRAALRTTPRAKKEKQPPLAIEPERKANPPPCPPPTEASEGSAPKTECIEGSCDEGMDIFESAHMDRRPELAPAMPEVGGEEARASPEGGDAVSGTAMVVQEQAQEPAQEPGSCDGHEVMPDVREVVDAIFERVVRGHAHVGMQTLACTEAEATSVGGLPSTSSEQTHTETAATASACIESEDEITGGPTVAAPGPPPTEPGSSEQTGRENVHPTCAPQTFPLPQPLPPSDDGVIATAATPGEGMGEGERKREGEGEGKEARCIPIHDDADGSGLGASDPCDGKDAADPSSFSPSSFDLSETEQADSEVHEVMHGARMMAVLKRSHFPLEDINGRDIEEIKRESSVRVESPMDLPLAGAPRSLAIKILPFTEEPHALSEWIRPTSARHVSAWGGTPSPTASPTFHGLFPEGGGPLEPNESTSDARQGRSRDPCEEDAPTLPPSPPSPPSPPKPAVNYSHFYQRFEDVFVRFGDAKPTTDSKNNAAGRPKSRGLRRRESFATAATAARMVHSQEDLASFYSAYAAALSSWLNERENTFATIARENGKGDNGENGENWENEENEEEGRGGCEGRAEEEPSAMRCYRVDCDSHKEVYDLVTSALHATGSWCEDHAKADGVPHWNILWTWSSKVRGVDHRDLNVWQRINHYPGAKQLTRKDLLNKNLRYYKALYSSNRKLASMFDIMPVTFSLPQEYVQFCNAFSEDITFDTSGDAGGGDREGPPKIVYGINNTWIMKPVGSSRGRGIFIVNSIEEVEYGEAFVIQKYLSNPLLVHGHKFDLRLYVLVTCFNPLEAWIYEEGFARFCAFSYSKERDGLGNKFVHLTNSSVQKEILKDPDFAYPEYLQPIKDAEDPLLSLPGGSKCSLAYLKVKLGDMGIEWGGVWRKIVDAVLAALFAAQAKIPFQANSFELFGFDVMLDQDLKVWLIEVNASPSLGTDTPLDKLVKRNLLCDIVRLVDPVPYDRPGLLKALLMRRTAKAASGDGGGQAGVNADVHAILRGARPRQYGEMPEAVGRFQRIAPSNAFSCFARLKGQGGATKNTNGAGGGGGK